MARVAVIGLLFLALFGCSTTGGVSEVQRDESALTLLDLSNYPANVYVGVSGPYSTKERMVEQAILACSKSILLEKALALDNKTVVQESSARGLLSFAQKEKAYYDDTSLKAVVDRLEVLSVLFDAEAGAVVLARDPTQSPLQRSYKAPPRDGGRPDWLVSLPHVDGYRFGIGSSRAYRFFNDSLEASDFSAAQNLLDLYTEHAFSKGLVTSREGSANSMDNVLYQAQRGLLEGFSIVDRYYDKEDNTYWSLASIREKGAI